MDSKKLGAFGEKIALDFLQKKGYQILDKNYLPKFLSGPQRGEIDIVAKPRRSVFDILRGKKDDIVHFIEVKTLAGTRGGPTSAISPEEKVDFLKQRKIIKTSESWLVEKKIPLTSKWQIDVIAIQIDLDSKKAKIRFLKNAVFKIGY